MAHIWQHNASKVSSLRKKRVLRGFERAKKHQDTNQVQWIQCNLKPRSNRCRRVLTTIGLPILQLILNAGEGVENTVDGLGQSPSVNSAVLCLSARRLSLPNLAVPSCSQSLPRPTSNSQFHLVLQSSDLHHPPIVNNIHLYCRNQHRPWPQLDLLTYQTGTSPLRSCPRATHPR